MRDCPILKGEMNLFELWDTGDVPYSDLDFLEVFYVK